MTNKPLKKGATYDDLVRVPEHYVAEMFDGDLYVSPRPAAPHLRAATRLAAKLDGPFDFEGPGGWILLAEPELHFGSDVLVPDIAGWRRERLPSLANDAYLTLAPDWVCEVLSPSTEALDRGKKLRIYAREGVAHAWLVDPLLQSLEVLALESGMLAPVALHQGDENVRARPFDALELDLRALWIQTLCVAEGAADLEDVLVKYFAAGLRNRERCFWVTAEPINCARAIRLRVNADKQVLGIRRRSLVVVHTSRELQALVVR